MNGKRKSAKERETTGWQLGLIALFVVVFGLMNRNPWAVLVGIVLAIIGAIMWGAGMARSD